MPVMNSQKLCIWKKRRASEMIENRIPKVVKIEIIAELAEELDVINGEMDKMAKMREFNDDPGAFDRILRSRVERKETGS